MKIDYQKLDEKALPDDQSGPFELLRQLRELIKKREEEKDKMEVGEEQKISSNQIEQNFLEIAKKLVNKKLWKVQKFPILAVADIFNEIGELLVKWKDLDQNSLQNLLNLGQILTSKTQIDNQTKINNVKVRSMINTQPLVDIIQQSEDFKCIWYAAQITQNLNQKRIQGKFLHNQMSELGKRFQALALGPNNLKDSTQDWLSLSDIATNKQGFIEKDIFFEYEVQPQSLSDKVQFKKIPITRDQILQSQKSIQDLAAELAKEHGQENDIWFIKSLEVKINWVKYVKDSTSLKDACLTQIYAISVASNPFKFKIIDQYRGEEGNSPFQKYIKDRFMEELKEALFQMDDPHILSQLLQVHNKTFNKDHYLPNLNSFMIAHRVDGMNEDEEVKPIIVQIMQDLASLSLSTSESSFTPLRSSQPSMIKPSILKSNDAQYHLANFIAFIIKNFLQVSRTMYQDTILEVCSYMLKVIDDVPVQNYYCYSPKVQTVYLSILKMVLRPRYEEQFKLVERLEKRILSELHNLNNHELMTYQEDEDEDLLPKVELKDRASLLKVFFAILCEQILKDSNFHLLTKFLDSNIGVSRKVLEGQLMNRLVFTMEMYNNEKDGHLIDDFISKHIYLLGTVCSDSPPQIPNLIKQGVIPGLIKSLEKRIPVSHDILSLALFTLNQITLHEQGQQLVQDSSLFDQILQTTSNVKINKTLLAQHEWGDSPMSRNLRDFFDRNAQFKEKTKKFLEDSSPKVSKLLDYILAKYMEMQRNETLTLEDKQKEYDKIQKSEEYCTIFGNFSIMIIVANLLNPQYPSRHAQDIITIELFQYMLEVFERLSICIPIFLPLHFSLLKTFRFFIDQNAFPVHTQYFVERFKGLLSKIHTDLQGKDIEKLSNLQDLFKDDKKYEELAPINEYSHGNREATLTKKEQLSQQFLVLGSYFKAFTAISSQMRNQIVTQGNFKKEIQIVFALQRLIFRIQSYMAMENLKELEKDQESQRYKDYGQSLFSPHNTLDFKQKDKDNMTHIQRSQEFFREVVEASIEVNFGFKIRDLSINEFLNKIWVSCNQNVNRGNMNLRENAFKNLIVFGEMYSKATKAFSKQALSQLKVDVNSYEFMQKLKQFHLICFELVNNQFLRGCFDGQPFYNFFMSGGLNNLFSLYHFLRNNISQFKSEQKHFVTLIYDSTCELVTEFIQNLIEFKNVDNSKQAFVEAKIDKQIFESPKHFFYNVVNSMITNLQDSSQESQEINSNPLIILDNDRNLKLVDIYTTLFTSIAKNFPNVIYFKDGQPHHRGRRGNEFQPDQSMVENMVAMGFTRERATRALQQFQGNPDHALNYLFENQANLEADENQPLSSDESLVYEEMIDLATGQEQRKPKFEPLSCEKVQENMKQAQQRGFQQMLQANQLAKIEKQTAKDYFYLVMINEKDEKVKRDMFISLYTHFKSISTQIFKKEDIKSEEGKDQIMTDVKEQQQEETSNLELTNQLLSILQKLTLKEKSYFKHILKPDIVYYLQELTKGFINKLGQEDQSEEVMNVYQSCVYDLFLLLFTLISLNSLQKATYQSEKSKYLVNPNPSEQEKKKREDIELKLKSCEYIGSLKDIQTCCNHLFEIYIRQKENIQKLGKGFMFKKSLVAITIAMAYKTVSEEAQDLRGSSVEKFFKQIEKSNASEISDQKIMTSFIIKSFQDPKLNGLVFEKLVLRVLHLRYEAQVEDNRKKKKDVNENDFDLSSTKYTKFLDYFKILSQMDKDQFSNVLRQVCEVKGQKKNEKVQLDSTNIRLKEKSFQDVKKQITKERMQLKTLVKAIDLKNDKSCQIQIKQSRKALKSQLSQEQFSILKQISQMLIQETSEKMSDLAKFVECQKQNQKYLKTLEEQKKIDWKNSSQSNLMNLLSKLMLAYPQSVMTLFDLQIQPKRSFVNWFILDFVPSKILKHTVETKKVQPGEQQPLEPSEVKFSILSRVDMEKVEENVQKFLNNITGYNHLMNFNEQVVKHDLRNKFITESLLIIQKLMRNKNQQNQLELKLKLISCLIIIDALVNYKNGNATKQMTISKENYFNSIRTLVLRENQQLSQGFPQSFIKIANDLLHDVVDLTNKANSEIVRKSIDIILALGEFIILQKKKSKKQREPESMEEDKKSQENQSENEIMRRMEDESEDIERRGELDAHEDDIYGEEVMDEDLPHSDGDVIGNEMDQDDEDELSDYDDEQGDDDSQDEEDGAGNDEFDEDEDEGEDGLDDDDEDQPDEMFMGDDSYGNESDEEDVIIEERFERRGNHDDIINIHQGQIAHIIQGGGQIRNRPGVVERNLEWTQEEEDVRRLLVNFRNIGRNQNSQNPQYDLRYQLDRPNAPGWGRAERQQNIEQAQKFNLVEHMFEGLKEISDKDIFEIVLSIKSKYDKENQVDHPIIQDQVPLILRRDNELIIEAPENLNINPIQIFEDIQRRLMQDDNDFHIGGRRFLFDNILQGGDPMFQRPPPDINEPAMPDLGLVSHYMNRQTRNQAPENIGEQLLATMDFQIVQPPEEKKEVESASISSPKLERNEDSPEQVNLSRNLDNDWLRGLSFEMPPMNPPPMPNLPSMASQPLQPSMPLPSMRPFAFQPPRNFSLSDAFQVNFPNQPIFLDQPMENVQQQQQDQSRISPTRLAQQIVQEEAKQEQQQQNPPVQNQPTVVEQALQISEQAREIAQQTSQQREEKAAEQLLQQPSSSEIKQEEVQAQQPLVQNQQPLVNQEINVAEEEKKAEAQPAQNAGKTFGYDNDYLLAHDIDPAILVELPEELRAELLSTLEPIQVNQNQQQPSAAQQQNQQLADELGLDPEFLANIPEEFRRELIQNEQMRNRNLGREAQQTQPRREAEQMDIASFIATVTDPSLRREIFSNMDEATINSLPSNLLAEYRQIQDQLRNERHRLRERAFDNPMARGGFHHNYARGMGGAERDFMEMFGGPRQREANIAQNQEIALEQSINNRINSLTDEADYEDTVSALTFQLGNDEKILEAIFQVFFGNDQVECDLIPCLQVLAKLKSTNGNKQLRNKIINGLTFIMKSVAQEDEKNLQVMIPSTQLKKTKIALMAIGCLRLLIKENKKLIKHILKSLLSRDEYFKNQGMHIMKKQAKALQGAPVIPPLSEIFQLVKLNFYKNEKSLMRNLPILIQQILKQFGSILDELQKQNQKEKKAHQLISKETVESLAEVLSLTVIDNDLLLDFGEFLFKICRQNEANYKIITEYCEGKSGEIVDHLVSRLSQISINFKFLKTIQHSPSVRDYDNDMSQSPSQSSIHEEENKEMQIDTINRQETINATKVKLSQEDEKILKGSLKFTEETEILQRLFKLFNLFFEKFSDNKREEQKDLEIYEQEKKPPKADQVIYQIIEFYNGKNIKEFVRGVNEVLRIVYNSNIEINTCVSNLIYCVFATFCPEFYEQSILEEQSQQSQEGEGKFKIKMLPITDSNSTQNEKFVLFKNSQQVTPRLELLSNFCQRNKKLINKLIKAKPQMNELFKQMPNLLDFENKMTYFKQELTVLRRQNYGDQINLYIRRDDIFMDAFHQLQGRTAQEMKGKLYIQFTGERGQDAGGLTRDFYIELSREMFNPNYSLFKISNSGATYYPNPKSYVEPNHLQYFKFIGRIIGKAIFDECLLDCYFVKSLYKVIIGDALSFLDLEDFDNELFSNLTWCLNNDVETLMQNFAVEQDFFGRMETKELIENGKNISVTNENKKMYVEKLTFFKLYLNIKAQIDAFLEGFYELIPKELIQLFNCKELELLISGLPDFDVNDLRSNTDYMGYSAQSPQVLWLWEILESFTKSEKAEFLQFVTGCSKVPVDGFKGLMGMRGPQKFTIAKIKTDDIMRLPSGHTCFNQIDIPEYPTKEVMHERVLTAIKETKGFGFA